MLNSRFVAILVLVVALSGASTWASIENKPVKVTHRNSGPRYDIDEVEKTKLTPENSAPGNENQIQPARIPPNTESTNNGESGEHEHPTIGHINIRRIFLVPMMPAHHESDSNIWSQGSRGGNGNGGDETNGERETSGGFFGPSSLSKPMLSFGLPPSRHLFGADQASRSPVRADESFERPSVERQVNRENSAPIGGEREDSGDRSRVVPGIDPIQMMIEMMQQALSQAVMSPNSFFNDLNKDASNPAKPAGDSSSRSEPNKPDSESDPSSSNDPITTAAASRPLGSEAEQPMKPVSNETREDVVEIDGKKYLRKTIVNRHVGENIIFMTKRLLFVPLNETTDAQNAAGEQTNTSTAPIPISSTNGESQTGKESTPAAAAAAAEPSFNAAPTTPVNEESRKEEATTTVASTTSEAPPTSTTPEPASSSTTTTTPSTTTVFSGEETTPKQSFADKVTDAVEKASERLLEGVRSTTGSKPKTSS